MDKFYMMLGHILLFFYSINDVTGDRLVCSEGKIFINYPPNPSACGWYRQDGSSCMFSKSDPESNNFDYHFGNEDGVWKLASVEYMDNGGANHSVLFRTTENYTNLFHTQPTNLKTKKRNGFPSSQYQVQVKKNFSDPSRRYDRKRARKQQLRGTDLSQESLEELETDISLPLDRLYVINKQEDDNDDELKLYPSKRCSCTKLEILYNRIQYSIFFRVDTNKDLFDRCNHSDVVDAFNYTDSHQWKPEFYLSERCQLIQYINDSWWIELSSHCTPSEKGFYLIWSDNTAPCIEYLPPPHRQVWRYFSRLTVFDDPNNYDIYLENCGGRFKDSIFENFTVECISADGGMTPATSMKLARRFKQQSAFIFPT